MKHKFLIAGLILYLIAAVISVASHHGFAINPLVGEIIRWAAVIALILFGYSQRSLTTWILVCMVLGAEVGNDFPHFAENLQILSQIFLRMIRVIIAPLLFATLVSGIGGHSDIKKVGRLGWKSLVYFEIVTTLALVIGLAAINISKAATRCHRGKRQPDCCRAALRFGNDSPHISGKYRQVRRGKSGAASRRV